MDPIGTVRRENHQDGYSLWIKVGSHWNCQSRWHCLYSPTVGNVGRVWSGDYPPIEDVTPVVGVPYVHHTSGDHHGHPGPETESNA